jgi:restriction endonuclease S subunit
MLSSQNVFDNRLDLSSYRFVSEEDFQRENQRTRVSPGDVLLTIVGTIGRSLVVSDDMPPFMLQRSVAVLGPNPSLLQPNFLARVLQSSRLQNILQGLAQGVAQKGVYLNALRDLQIPLPPLELQKEIVSEIDGYQKVISGARAVLDHYHPYIPIHPDWSSPTFEEAPFQIIDGDRGTNYPSKEDFSPSGHCLFLNTKNVRSDGFKFDELEFISEEKDKALRKGKLERGDVLLTTRGTIGNTALYDASVEFDDIRINSGMLIFRPDAAKLSSSYLFHFFQSENFRAQRESIVSGAAQPQLPIRSLNEAKIPLPPLATQQAIVAEIEAEQALVAANRELITRFEKKIQVTLARIWGEEAPVVPEA